MKTTNRLARTLSLLPMIALGACAPAFSAQAPLPFVLVTVAPNASPTPTPFQPSLPEAAAIRPAADSALPTGTASPTPSQPAELTPTVDLNQLFPTAAAPPIIEDSGAQPT